MNHKIKLLQKLKRLAADGVGGEKINAEKMLKQLMQKYNISDLDLEQDKIEQRYIKISRLKIHQRLFMQVLSTFDITTHYGKGVHRWVDCTAAQHIEIEAKYNFYLNHFKKDFEVFYLAFLQANSLFPKKSDNESEPTRDEIKKWERASLMSFGMDKHAFKKQIQTGDKS